MVEKPAAFQDAPCARTGLTSQPDKFVWVQFQNSFRHRNFVVASKDLERAFFKELLKRNRIGFVADIVQANDFFLPGTDAFQRENPRVDFQHALCGNRIESGIR